MEDHLETCANCEKEFKDGFEFCPHCGQKAKDDLTIGVLFYNTISNYFSFDARFFRSFIPLMLKPGFVARKFVEGKRLQYLHPAQYYLFVSVIFFFIFSIQTREQANKFDEALKKGFEGEFVQRDSIPDKVFDSTTAEKLTAPLKNPNFVKGMSDDDRKELDSIIQNANKEDMNKLSFDYDQREIDSLITAGANDNDIMMAMGMDEGDGYFARLFYGQLLKFQKKRGDGILAAFYDSIPLAMFFLLPIFALLLKLFYWRRGRFSHHLVFSFYYFSFLFVVFSLVFGLNIFLDIPDWIDWLVVLSTFLYLWLAVRRFYQQGYIVSLIKSGFLTFIYMIFIIPIAAVVMFATTFVFY